MGEIFFNAMGGKEEGYDQFKNKSVKKRFNHKPMILFLEMKIFEKTESEWLVSSRVFDKQTYDVDQMSMC